MTSAIDTVFFCVFSITNMSVLLCSEYRSVWIGKPNSSLVFLLFATVTDSAGETVQYTSFGFSFCSNHRLFFLSDKMLEPPNYSATAFRSKVSTNVFVNANEARVKSRHRLVSFIVVLGRIFFFKLITIILFLVPVYISEQNEMR